MNDPFLTRDPADKEHIRLLGIDLVPGQDGRIRRRPVLIQVDAVGDDFDALERDAIKRMDVRRMAFETAITPSAFW